MKGKKRASVASPERMVDESVEARRVALVQERQAQLESVFDRHDTLVREAFHLEKFVSLLSYDPQVAKEDNSNVFREYKAQYDLLDKAATASGSSRKTRRAHSERFDYLTGAAGPSTPTSTSPIKRQTAQSKKSRTPAPKGDDAVIWDILASRKAKGKGKASDGTPLSSPAKGKGRQDEAEEPESIVTVYRPSKKKTGEKSIVSPAVKRSTLDESSGDAFSKHPRKRRKTEPMLPTSQSWTDESTVSSATSNQDMPPPDTTEGSLASSTVGSRTLRPSLARRVTLIVRKPPPTLTNPRQRPPPAPHGKSLSSFLTSYSMLEQGDVDSERLHRMASRDARLWSKYDTLRKEGKVVDMDIRHLGGGRMQPSHSDDPWSHIVSTISHSSRRRYPSGQHIAGQIASRIRAYWEGQSMRDDKVRAQEEKRLRALAKATIRMVTAEWKKAVFHIREQERLRLEEEERRRGREHLDAILDQSGQILEAQHGDLARDVDMDRDEIEQSDQGEEMQASDLEEDSEDDPAEGEDASQLDTSALLNTEAWSVPRSASETTASQSPDFLQDSDDAPEASTILVESPMAVNLPLKPPDMPTFDYVQDHVSYIERQLFKEADNIPRRDHSRSPVPRKAVRLVDHRNPSSQSPPQPPGNADGSEAISKEVISVQHADIAIEDATQPDAIQSEASSQSPDLIKDISHELKWSTLQDAAHDNVLSTLGEETKIAEEDVITTQEVLSPRNTDSGLAFSEVFQSEVPSKPEAPVYDSVPPGSMEEPGTDEEYGDENNSEEDARVPAYLRPFAVAPVDWDPQDRIKPPLLLRGVLRPYQQAGLEWLASLHTSHLNGILADEMGLGKTIQTIALLAHLACDRGIWGPHLIIVPTSVILNWEMEFKKFLPGFKVLSYHGPTKRRKELRQGWSNKYHFNVCITSYTLASRDAHIFKRKPWYYMILDEAHMIKNFKSQRWNILLMFRSFRRLLLTGTPLQNNLTELWALLQFLMSGTDFANVREFSEWFANPLEKAVEAGNAIDEETQQRVAKLHTVLRPYLLRRLKRDVEKELPSKYEHVVLCPLSKRQRFLYDEFMSRRQTRDDLQSGVYQKIANILMQLRKVCNHPDLFEVRSIVTSFAMPRSAISGFEVKELLLRRRLLAEADEEKLNMNLLGLEFIQHQNCSVLAALATRRLDGTSRLPLITELPGEPPPKDTRTIAGWKRYRAYQHRAAQIGRWTHIAYLNRLRCAPLPIYSSELLNVLGGMYLPIVPLSCLDRRNVFPDTPNPVNAAVKSYRDRSGDMTGVVDRFAFVTPAAVALDLPRITLSGSEEAVEAFSGDIEFDGSLHRAAVKLQIAFPDPALLQYDCGKLQKLSELLKERKAGGHRCLIFTQMTRILDILEIFLNLHGYLYLRLDGATKIEDRQYITERFNADPRILCFISSSRSGGVGINLTGADTVIFYDSDFNPQMDRQCEDRAHRIGQIRDVHIFRFISEHTVEEALLRKANQKRNLDDLVIQKGEFDWRRLFEEDGKDETALTRAMGELEDVEDRRAAHVAAREEIEMTGADEADFETTDAGTSTGPPAKASPLHGAREGEVEVEEAEEVEDEGTTVDYMLSFVRFDYDFFRDWKI
ncbi:hypothetical protein GLOTRDRAFT_106023 [Gloeophyllum trabeum ATCC 11539]|uniref:Helicase SWR1 n=1 Tax=Gloeophyllum trabeum (strain ATCC 11539 / FP-39264 / Madison 617) TaxID=670483 RepID=S7RM70_GLOTA|nr:uncharacterized protein GLOTRDRAFT_106023 [Gloeophyllum trabeum ATCC 11539]EPQ55485.1 hypothetical protein GLOTRDRAFT_106023 [Gloeophyllum trabeum ATCC 11539]